MKGRGVKAVEDLPDKHGKPLEAPEPAIEELGGPRDLRVRVVASSERAAPHRFPEAATEDAPR